jgi:hypothetical protein
VSVDIGDVLGTLGRHQGPPETLLELAESAAEAADEVREAKAKAEALKTELDEALKAANRTEITLSDRRVISYKLRKERRCGRGTLVEIMGEEKGKETWSKVPQIEKPYLDIPKLEPTEPES